MLRKIFAIITSIPGIAILVYGLVYFVCWVIFGSYTLGGGERAMAGVFMGIVWIAIVAAIYFNEYL